jgi:hypothetical protein
MEPLRPVLRWAGDVNVTEGAVTSEPVPGAGGGDGVGAGDVELPPPQATTAEAVKVMSSAARQDLIEIAMAHLSSYFGAMLPERPPLSGQEGGGADDVPGRRSTRHCGQ